MENTIRKIFSEKVDEEVHREFVKFSKGIFENRYLIEAKKQKDRWSIKTGAEFANYFVRKCLEKVSGKVSVKGVIVATFDIVKDAGFEIKGIKQFMGIKQAVVDGEIEAGKIISLMNRQPKAFYALSFSTSDGELKIKPKAPKSAKPSTKGEGEIKIDFCSLKTSDKKIVDDLLFDFPNFEEIQIRHTLMINEIILPKNEKDPVKMRELSKRKGVVKRIARIDDAEKVSEKEFEA